VGRRIAQLREATVAAGRPVDAVDAVVTGNWPMLDIRTGWDADARLADLEHVEQLGADWVVVTVCGDDPAVAEETVQAYGEQVLAVWKGADPDVDTD
jgi:hypothetical protein